MSEPVPLAAEYVLRLLEGEDLLEARRRAADDPAFADEIAFWEAQFAPLFDEIAAEAPSRDLWARIVERLDRADPAVLTLRRQLNRWKGATLLAAAAAAILLVVAVRPTPTVAPPQPTVVAASPLLVAALGKEGLAEGLTVAFRPDQRELAVNATKLEVPTGRARQLWVIPAGGAPISLGLVRDGAVRRALPPQLAAVFKGGATIAVSDEPTGGSPTGQPTGEVLAATGLVTI